VGFLYLHVFPEGLWWHSFENQEVTSFSFCSW
jgi:hypothetical protein